jgi:hypothetical protein
MNRRSFLSTLLVAPIAVKAVAAPLGPFGFVDVDRWHALGLFGSHGVFLDGVEVTNGAIWFNDVAGQVGRYVLLEDRMYANDENGEPMVEVLRGDVTVRPVEPYGGNVIKAAR